MDALIKPQLLQGTLQAPCSKSLAHRYFIATALSENSSTIKYVDECEDVKATINCLKALGAEIKKTNEDYLITPITQGLLKEASQRLESKEEHVSCLKNNASQGVSCKFTNAKTNIPYLNCQESGTTFRLLLPLASTLYHKATFTGSTKLAQRPLFPLDRELNAHGVSLSWNFTTSPKNQDFPLTTQGLLSPGTYRLQGNVSSQFMSGIVYACSQMNEKSSLIIDGHIESLPYLKMTLSVLNDFGMNLSLEKTSTGYVIEINPKKLVAPQAITVEGDWSNAAFWLCAGTLSSEGICITGLNNESLQGDKSIANILKKAGANISYNQKSKSYYVKKSQISNFVIDASQIPDLIPILSLLASTGTQTSTIKNCQRLRFKESDRIKTTITTLKKLGIVAWEKDDAIIVPGNQKPYGGICSSYNDHRIAMMASIAGSYASNETIIKNADAVMKSYPHFYKDFKKLSGSIEYIPSSSN